MTMDPGAGAQSPGVLITMGQVYSEVTGMRQEIRDLTNSVRTAVAQIGDHETRLREVERAITPMADHEPRLTAVERKVWAAAGVVAVASSSAAAFITKALIGH